MNSFQQKAPQRATRRSNAPAAAPLMSPKQFAKQNAKSNPVRRLGAYLQRAQWSWRRQTTLAATRLIDILGSVLGLAILSPLLALVAIAIRTESRGPVLFKQTRVGLRGQEFTLFKFRSMAIDAEARKKALAQQNESSDGVIFKMKADPRVTRVGQFIRRFSIDELPQLLNVLAGHMSLVGPRPPVPAEVEQYNPHARKRLQGKPGLTCLWQISGRSELSFSQQVELDLRYLQQRSVFGDLSIMARTVPAVLSGKGAY